MDSCQDIYNDNQQLTEETDEAAQWLQQHEAPKHLWESLAPGKQQHNLEAKMEGQTVLRGFGEHETVEDILQDNDHTDKMNTVLGKHYTKKAYKELLAN